MEQRIAIQIRGETACAEVARGVRRYARGRSDWLIRAVEAERGSSRENRERILAWRPNALIYNGRFEGTLESFRVAVSGPIVSLYRYDLNTPAVCVDQRAVGRMLAEHLMELGLRHLAFFRESYVMYAAGYMGFAAHCAEGFAERVREEGLTPIMVEPLPLSAFTWEAEDRAYTQVLDKLPKPVGIATSNDDSAKRISDACASHHLTIPDDIALIGVGNERLVCDLCMPTLSSIAVPSEELGYRAAELIDRAFRGEAMPSEPQLLPPMEVVERGSTDIVSAVQDELVGRSLRFLQDHLEQGVNVEDLLDHVGVSRKKLEIRFRAVRGRTPRMEIERMRISRAKRLLVETSMSMARIAECCGFGSSVRFSAVFHSVVGEPPSSYRKRNR